MSKGGSKVLTGIIAFILGFLFAVLVEIGAIFGVYWYVMNKDLDSVLGVVGIQNTDEDGNKKYINTDTENGGVKNLKELLSAVKGLVFEDGELAIVGKSFDEINELIPATQMVLDVFYGIADDYIEIDREEFESNPLMNLAQVLSDSVLNVKTAPLMEKLNVFGDADVNVLVKTLLMGSECDYATVTYADGRESNLKFPVMYDYYSYNQTDDTYSNCADNAGAFHSNLVGREEELLTPSGDRYALYYVPCRVTDSGIEEAEYLTGETTAEKDGKTYKFQILEYGADTDFIAVEYNNGKFVINYNTVYASLNEDATDSEGKIDYSQRFTGFSYYVPYAQNYYYQPKGDEAEDEVKPVIKTYSGKNYFRDNQDKMIQLDALTLYDIMVDPFSPLDAVLVSEVIEGESDIKKIFGTLTLGMLLRGEGIDEIIDDLEVSTFMTDVAPSNKVMCYIAYKISDLQSNGDGTYTAIYDKDGADEQVVTVHVEDGFITGVVDDDGAEVDGVKVKDIASLANNMPITVLMDVDVEEPIMVYLGYGVKQVKAQTGDGYRYVGKVNDGNTDRDCYIATEDSDGVENVLAVWYYDDEGNRIVVGGTKVNNVADRMNSFADDLTVGDVLSLDGSEGQLLSAIKDTPLSQMGNRIDELTVGEIISGEEIDKSSILSQLKNTKVTELATAIDKLFIQRVYAKEVYGLQEDGDPAEAGEYNEEWLYYTEVDGVFVLANAVDNPPANDTAYDDALGHITEQEFNEGTYYTYGGAKGMWRLVLYKNGKEKAYTMNNFNNMVAACADSVNDATLTELKKAGVVDATEEQLAKKLKFSNGGVQCYVKADGNLTFNEAEGVTLGEMKLASLINFVVTNLLAE